MAKCKQCNQEMLDSVGCLPKIKIGGRIYERIKYGDPVHDKDIRTDIHCHDCEVSSGMYHHFGCDMERCPICGGQMLMHILTDYTCEESELVIEALIDENGNEVDIDI